MKLNELAEAVKAVSITGDPETEIRSVIYDSRKATPGDIFAAVRGLNADGRKFIPMAIEKGASAVLADAPVEEDVPVIMVEDVREGMALAAAALHGNPCEALTMVGLTGTNGKTTTTFLLESILKAAGKVPGVLGTVNFRCPGKSWPAPNTTPEGPDLQYLLAEIRDAGADHAVMEVSSHAIDLSRVAGCRFDVAVFTNLTQDHLDYHETLEAYFEAKKRLFTEYLNGPRPAGGPRAVINIDDEWGRKLADELGEKAMTVSLSGKADLCALEHSAGRTGVYARVSSPMGKFEISSGLLGDVNIYNMLSATGAALCLGIDPETITRGLKESKGAPGRLERVGGQDDYIVLVDYAHTPDALEQALKVVRKLKPNRLVSVFGCGGDRDRSKRPLMGKAAAGLSDLAIVTSDNPRTEDPLAIIEDIEAGIRELDKNRLEPGAINGSFKPGSYTVIPDRRAAIKLACRLMQAGDMVIVAGKGHEDYQVLGKEKIHFDDREEAGQALTVEGKF